MLGQQQQRKLHAQLMRHARQQRQELCAVNALCRQQQQQQGFVCMCHAGGQQQQEEEETR